MSTKYVGKFYVKFESIEHPEEYILWFAIPSVFVIASLIWLICSFLGVL